MIYVKRIVSLILVVGLVFLFSGCDTVEKFKINHNMKNEDFEFIKQGKIKKIIIQNTRDKGFRFIVTDKRVINELYDILSTAKVVKQKSNLEPDYIFQMEESPQKIYSYYYVAGLYKEEEGNLYSDDKIYEVSKNLDNDIVKNFWNLRKPKEFQKIYYNSILQALSEYDKDDNKAKKIGINISDDMEAAKFIFSRDIEDFKYGLAKMDNAEILNKDKQYDVIMSVKTQGYKSEIYKSVVSFSDNTDNSEKKYYIIGEYKNEKWDIKVSSSKPSEF